MIFLSRLPELVSAGSLTQAEAFHILQTVLGHSDEQQCLRPVLTRLDHSGLFVTGEQILAIISDVLSRHSLKELRSGLDDAFEDELLDGVQAKANAQAILNHVDPKGLARCLIELQFAGLLDSAQADANRHTAEVNVCPWDLAQVLIVLQKVDLLGPDVAQARFNAVAAHRDLRGLYLRLDELLLSNALTLAAFQEEITRPVAEAPDWSELEALADDDESATRALSPEEERRLGDAMAHYQPRIIELGGVEPCFQRVLQALAVCYEQNPVRDLAGEALPFTWDDFNELDLQGAVRVSALDAYYQHPVHTAYRYLSAPNPWMSPDALFVCQYSGDPGVRWADFDRYKSLIGMLFLAASDEGMAPTNDHTVATRVAHFFNELAMIGRAHNWDNAREKVDAAGHVPHDGDNSPIMEFYDDGEGDKPSCDQGVRARLFQSVPGHALLGVLTQETIKQELAEYVRAHFCRQINDNNHSALHAAWNALIDVVPLDNVARASNEACLGQLNVSLDDQARFLDYLTQKYVSFQGAPDLRECVIRAFAFDSTFPHHALRFGGETRLDGLLRRPVLSNTRPFFSSNGLAPVVIEPLGVMNLSS